jgi:transglutaminase-like putative cysteine protease
MQDTIACKLSQWTAGKRGHEAMLAVFNRIRDIPYAVIPELNHPEEYLRILETNRGSCTPKHLLLCRMFQRLGLEVLYVVYPYRWAEFEELYPQHLWELAERMPPVNHLACRVYINGHYVLVDATIDPPLGSIGLPVNYEWDGISDTALPVLPIGPEEIYHPSEAALMPPPDLDDAALEFYHGLNDYFEEIRRGQAPG